MASVIDTVQARIAEWAQANPRTKLAKRSGVQLSDEFERIDSLPRRVWSDSEGAELAVTMTEILKLDSGGQVLRPIQAIALYEIAESGGLVAPIRVGGGKTLISLLAPVVLGAYRPLLILPAKLIPKTRRDMKEAAKHWPMPRRLIIKSYDWLGRTQATKYFETVRPDLIVLDEAHRARNTKAAVTRRIKRYVEKYNPRLVAMSGTLIRKRLLDWAHLAHGALGDRAPVPIRYTTIVEWGAALDHNATLSPGVLRRWADREGGTDPVGLDDVRAAYRKRVVETPGIVATTEGLLGVGLTIEAWRYPVGDAIDSALATLESDWVLPDGLPITDPLHYYRACRTVALGVYYRYRYPPPAAWLDARRAWGAFVRHAVRYLRDAAEKRPFDSELQVAQSIQAGRLIDDGSYSAWRGIRDTFKPEIEYVWITHDVIDAIIALAKEERSIVWCESVAVGLAMHERGLTYYGAKGLSPDKRSILDADITQPFAASIQSAGEGQNLQAWCSAIMTAPMPDAGKWEQAIGREHREGQEADEVTVKVAMLGDAHEVSWSKAIDHAHYLESITGQEQKLLQATLIDMPEPSGA